MTYKQYIKMFETTTQWKGPKIKRIDDLNYF